MTQNTSSAVMQQRAEAHDSLDDFPTPPWATRALCGWMFTRWAEAGYDNPLASPVRPGVPSAVAAIRTAREPAANRGHMVRPLREFFGSVEASDVHDYGAGFPVRDYLWGPDPAPVDWTITNPPFRLAEQFIQRALRTSRHGVAVIVRTAFLEGTGRHARLFSIHPPSTILQFSERVVMHKGRLSPKGSTATAYCWIVWTPRKSHAAPVTFDWIPPCRAQLERPEDYA
jgi:hypothetical protein